MANVGKAGRHFKGLMVDVVVVSVEEDGLSSDGWIARMSQRLGAWRD